MNGIQQSYTPEEQKKLEEHKAWYAKLRGFTCVGCSRPRQKTQFGRYGVFRPKKEYTKVLLPVTYIVCDECMKLSADELYDRVEKWLVDHGHLVL